MSLLSTPTGRPDRVYSLVSLVRAYGGRIRSGEAKEWLAPQYRSADGLSSSQHERDSKTGERVQEVFRVARDLRLLAAEKDDWVRAHELPATRREFARYCHAHLCSLPPLDADSVLFRAYAWCVAYIERHGIAPLAEKSAKDLATQIAAALGKDSTGDDEKAFNTTKLSAWKDWMAYLGLGWNDLPGVQGFLPDPSRRVEDELPMLLPSAKRVDARSFVAAMGVAFPYLDGGRLFDEACSKGLSAPPAGQLSRTLSHTMRALTERGVLRCEMLGDAQEGIGLFSDPLSKFNAFSHLERGEAFSHV